jgi:RNA polymerase sigma factor (sigma-70 family)
VAVDSRVAGPGSDRRTDAELMACLAGGGVACLGEFSRRYQEHIRRLAFRILGRWDTADDVVQEALLRVRRGASGYRPEALFTTWLHRIVVNLCHDLQRGQQRAPGPLPAVDPAVNAEPASRMASDELSRRVAAAVGSLPQRQRTALVLHRYQGLSHQQVAEATGWSTSAVESLLVRAYARLREELADLHDS